MEIRADIEERVTVVSLAGEVGEGDLERVERALQALRRRGSRRIMLDLGEARALNADPAVGVSVIEAVKSLVGTKGTKRGRPVQATV